MCKSARWWVAFKGGELPPGRLWALLLMLGSHHMIVAFNHAMYVFQAYRPPMACQEYAADGSYVTSPADCRVNCTGRYVFVGADEDATIVTEWSLVCSRAALRPLMGSLYFLGVAVGALVTGFLADRLGRRPVMAGCVLCQALAGIAVSFAPSLEAFAVLRTLHGVFIQGLQGSTFTLLMELFPSHLRTAVGIVQEIYWATGLVVLSGLAYLLPHWRDLQLAVSAPTLAVLLFLPWVPESRLWLASRGHVPPFRRGLPGFGSYRAKKEVDGLSTLPRPRPAEDASHAAEGQASTVTPADLVMFTVALSYYVITFGMPSMTGDRFANFALGGVLEMASYSCMFVALSRLGRRVPLSVVLGCSSVASCGVAFILVGAGGDGGLPALVLVMLCKGTLVCCFCTLFIYTGELFPTAIRSAALGICGFMGRVGTLLSPQVMHLGNDDRAWLPFVLIGALLLAVSSSTLLLPETLGSELPATLEDAVALRVRGRAKGRGSPRSSGSGDRDRDSAEAQPLNNTAHAPGGRPVRLNLEDYKVPDWKSDIPQLEPDKVQTAKKRGSMSALELGQGLLEELNKTPAPGRADKARSLYLETNLDDVVPILVDAQLLHKTTVSSAV
ncbi:Solute carrier family 22 member 6 [Frankliniella fusca]|uniref:Solute carrier family 22 member 6 n=1 Tax=Frankliniella fusca TaxID=407009 RepID=A0AAE1HJR0_9NEOP|nr:Solute carrier family 22 member 6 [Frankliniella fusca]